MFKGTKYRLFFLLLLFAGSVAVLAYILVQAKYGWLILAVPFFLISLLRIFRLFSQNTRKITFMLNAIANGDYSFQFTEYAGNLSDSLLNMTLNRMRDILQQKKDEIVRREEYYSLILNSVNTGILVINESGSVYQSNEEVLKQFGLPILTHVSQLRKIDETLPSALLQIREGKKRQVSFANERGEVTLSIRCSSTEVQQKQMRILAINEIGNELAEKELESWIRLIRVLTHEIMNSITPITSLSETLIEMTGDQNPELRSGLETIHASGKGLTSFVESYRQLTRIPAPRPTLIDVKPFLERAVRLVGHEFSEVSISISMEPENLILYADETQVFQVVMNLLKNAAQALQGVVDPLIEIWAGCPVGENVTIRISNNGAMISPEVLSHIFIPFFTTKEVGSGIGLSLSRQVMRLHNGTISVQSIPDKTTFSLTFP